MNEKQPKTKMCKRCCDKKPVTEFTNDRHRKDGLCNYCRKCKAEVSRIYRENNVEEIRERKRLYSKKNKDAISKKSAKYYKANAERLLMEQKKYYQKNKEKYSLYERNRYHSNMQVRIKHNLSSRINNALSGATKNHKTQVFIGCSLEDFMSHIESMFTDGMSWENRSEWHIDHIRPCASFDLTDEDEQLKCFHYTNMQPLWASDNCSKGAKYDG